MQPYLDRLFEQDTWGTYIVVIDIDVNVDKLDIKVGEGRLTHSSATGLITVKDHPFVLVYVVGLR